MHLDQLLIVFRLLLLVLDQSVIHPSDLDIVVFPLFVRELVVAFIQFVPDNLLV